MAIMGYEEWIRRTKLGLSKPRSTPLKVLDAAVKEYGKNKGSPSHLETLEAAFIAWADTKGNAESSERNGSGAITDLMNQIINFKQEHSPARRLRPAGLLKDIKEGAKLMAEGKLKPQIKVKLTLGELDESKGSVLYEDFDPIDMPKAKKGWADAYRCADLAVIGVGKVGRDDKETERFRRWFGSPDRERVSKVAADLQKMQAAFKAAKVTIANRPDIQTHIIDNRDPFGQIYDGFTGGGVYGYVYNHQAGSGYRVIMGKHFLLDPDPVEGAAQTVYHELTHKVLKTKDHCYGKVKSRGLATMKPGDALQNADNYAYYAVSFIKDI